MAVAKARPGLNYAILARVLAKPGVVQAMRAQNVEPKSSEPAEASKLMHEDLERWKKIIQDRGIKAS